MKDITLEQFEGYLKKNGWRKLKNRCPQYNIWHFDEDWGVIQQIQLPESENCPEFSSRIQQLLKVLARIHDTTPEAIYRVMKTLSRDEGNRIKELKKWSPPMGGLEWLETVFEKNYPADLPQPRFYPIYPGNVGAEWSSYPHIMTVEFNLYHHTGEWEHIDQEAGQSETVSLELVSSDWEWLVGMVKKMVKNRKPVAGSRRLTKDALPPHDGTVILAKFGDDFHWETAYYDDASTYWRSPNTTNYIDSVDPRVWAKLN